MKRPLACIAFSLALCSSASTAAAADILTLGIHAHEPTNIDAASKTGYSAIRLWDTGTDWASLEPQQSLWKLDRIGAYLATSEKAHLKVLWTIGNTPRWASARPDEKCAYGFGCAAEPRDIDSWRSYVQTIATTFHGRIECYEPWNEASFPTDPQFKTLGAGGDPGEFFSGSVDAMVELARVSYQTIKNIDPGACVLSPSFHSTGNWAEKFDRYLAAGGGRYMEVASQHFYFDDQPEQTVPVIRVMKEILAKHGLSKIPIWNTEVGVSFIAKQKRWPDLSMEEIVYALTLRSYLINASEGVSRVYWYAWDNGNSGFFDPVTRQDIGTLAASAAVLQLKSAVAVNCTNTAAIWECKIRTAKTSYKVMWLSGKDNTAVPIVLDQIATRWGPITKTFPAGRSILLDARPIIINYNRP